MDGIIKMELTACMNYRMMLLAILFASSVVCFSCSLKEIKKQTVIVENAGYITGKVRVESHQKGTVTVLRFREENGILSLTNSSITTRDGEYKFVVPPGNYIIAAFIDVNNDGQYQQGEHGNFHLDPLLQKVMPARL